MRYSNILRFCIFQFKLKWWSIDICKRGFSSLSRRVLTSICYFPSIHWNTTTVQLLMYRISPFGVLAVPVWPHSQSTLRTICSHMKSQRRLCSSSWGAVSPRHSRSGGCSSLQWQMASQSSMPSLSQMTISVSFVFFYFFEHVEFGWHLHEIQSHKGNTSKSNDEQTHLFHYFSAVFFGRNVLLLLRCHRRALELLEETVKTSCVMSVMRLYCLEMSNMSS